MNSNSQKLNEQIIQEISRLVYKIEQITLSLDAYSSIESNEEELKRKTEIENELKEYKKKLDKTLQQGKERLAHYSVEVTTINKNLRTKPEITNTHIISINAEKNVTFNTPPPNFDELNMQQKYVYASILTVLFKEHDWVRIKKIIPIEI